MSNTKQNDKLAEAACKAARRLEDDIVMGREQTGRTDRDASQDVNMIRRALRERRVPDEIRQLPDQLRKHAAMDSRTYGRIKSGAGKEWHESGQYHLRRIAGIIDDAIARAEGSDE